MEFHYDRYCRERAKYLHKKKVKYQTILEMKLTFAHMSIAIMCDWFGITRQAYDQGI
jgi:hypothetical protein